DRAQHILRAQRVSGLVCLWRCLGVQHELQQPGAVSQVDEDQPAVVSAAVHPARDARLRASALGGELAAPGVPVAVGSGSVLHVSRLPRRIVGITSLGDSSSCSPVSMFFNEVPSSPTMATYLAPIRSACLSWPRSERPASSSWALRPARRASRASENAVRPRSAPTSATNRSTKSAWTGSSP